MKKTTSLTMQDFQNFIQLNNDVHWNFEVEYIQSFGNTDEDDRENLNEWVSDKAREYLETYFNEMNKDNYSIEQIEEIKLLLS